jgi:hypothetical protein
VRFRRLHRIWAALGGYFWLPCPLCGEFFGGHEWCDRDGRSSSIAAPDRGAGKRVAICPDCTRAGHGDNTNIVIWSGK